jgi:putative spermidine/putrescine transport system substrate-binding protein
VETGPPDYAKVKAMVEAKRVEWDVMQSDPDFVFRGKAENLLEPLDYNLISTKDFLPGAAQETGLIYDYGATVIAYRTDVYPAGKGPKSWTEFWDVGRFPGRRALSKDPYYLFPLALAADGVPKDKLYPIDVDRVFKSLDRIRPHVFKFYETFGQSSQLITDKEADLVAATTTRMYLVQKQGGPVHVELNEGVPWGDAWVVPRGTPRKAAAMKFIAFAAQHDEGMAIKARKTLTGMTQLRTTRLLEPEVARALVTSPENWPRLLPSGDDWWAKNRPRMDQLMTAWLLKG